MVKRDFSHSLANLKSADVFWPSHMLVSRILKT